MDHPGIAAIFGIEEAEGSQCLIIELIEGRSLAERLREGALPVPEALEIARQLAEALEAAHERGVIHRDLKPGNVMVTPRGRVKVLDFGLAKDLSAPGEAPEPEAPTRAGLSTQAGLMLGTPGYMSPEQITTSPQDPRSDLFAFGAILFECLAGRPVFPGASTGEVLLATLQQEPAWTHLPPETPGEIRDLLSDCLEKVPGRRLASASDARRAIEVALGMRRPDSVRSSAMARLLPPHNLPVPLTSFVGREREIAACLESLRRTRLLTLTGVGGCGKSRLLLEAARAAAGEFPGGIWFADLAPIAEAMRVPHALLDALGLREEPGRPPSQTLEDFLSGRSGLLLLDNCEQVLEAVGVLATRLLADGDLKILCTSREPLGITGELVHRVPSLSLPAAGKEADPAEVIRSEAARLFAERAAFARPGFEIDARNARVIAELCRRLDGIPLAIELAAARVKVLAAEEVLERLRDRFRLLTGGSRTALPRHQTLQATIQWSYDLLSETERELFRTLAVFAGGWTLDAATYIRGPGADEYETLDLLSRLLDKSLVQTARGEDGGSRFRFLETVRQFALEKLDESGESGVARGRHLVCFEKLAAAESPNLIGAAQGASFARLEAEHENLLAALAWSERLSDGGARGLALAGSLVRFWHLRGHLAVGRDQLEHLLDHASPEFDPAARANAAYGAGVLADQMGDPAGARTWFRDALDVWSRLGDLRGIARANNGLGVLAHAAGDYETARLCYEQALKNHREVGNLRGVSIVLNNLGDIALTRKDHATAGPLFEESLDLARQVDDLEGVHVALENLARIALHAGRLDEARARFAEALRVAHGMGSEILTGTCLESIAELQAVMGHCEAAARLNAAAAAMLRTTDYSRSAEEAEIRDSTRSRVLAALGKERCQALEDEGQSWSPESAVEHARAWLHGG
jgi:non-specific serine/threonine protein kinase